MSLALLFKIFVFPPPGSHCVTFVDVANESDVNGDSPAATKPTGKIIPDVVVDESTLFETSIPFVKRLEYASIIIGVEVDNKLDADT